MENYKTPEQTKIGHVHLKVSNLDKALSFYRDLLGLEVTQYFGENAVFLSAGGYHHHIALNTWYSKDAAKASPNTVGLYHVAFLYPTRRDLALIVKRLKDNDYPIIGGTDHGVSEVIYLTDPDGNGVEVYWDRPKEQWPRAENGNLMMYNGFLDIEMLLKEI